MGLIIFTKCGQKCKKSYLTEKWSLIYRISYAYSGYIYLFNNNINASIYFVYVLQTALMWIHLNAHNNLARWETEGL